jgi:hypothetical protein
VERPLPYADHKPDIHVKPPEDAKHYAAGDARNPCGCDGHAFYGDIAARARRLVTPVQAAALLISELFREQRHSRKRTKEHYQHGPAEVESEVMRAWEQARLQDHGGHYEIEADGELLSIRLLVESQSVPAGGEKCRDERDTDRFQKGRRFQKGHSAIVLLRVHRVWQARRLEPRGMKAGQDLAQHGVEDSNADRGYKRGDTGTGRPLGHAWGAELGPSPGEEGTLGRACSHGWLQPAACDVPVRALRCQILV